MDLALFLGISYSGLLYFIFIQSKKKSRLVKEQNNILNFIHKDMSKEEIAKWWKDYKGDK